MAICATPVPAASTVIYRTSLPRMPVAQIVSISSARRSLPRPGSPPAWRSPTPAGIPGRTAPLPGGQQFLGSLPARRPLGKSPQGTQVRLDGPRFPLVAAQKFRKPLHCFSSIISESSCYHTTGSLHSLLIELSLPEKYCKRIR